MTYIYTSLKYQVLCVKKKERKIQNEVLEKFD